jgi:hypothetical protein
MECGAAGCNDDAVSVYCAAHGASKTDEERRRDGDERRDQ